MTPEEQTPEQTGEETTSRGAPRSPRKKHRPSLLGYLVVLFFAAFMLLLMSYFMQQRRSDQDTINGLQESISAMQSVDALRTQNEELRQQLEDLQDRIDALERELDQAWDDHAAVSDELAAVSEELNEARDQLVCQTNELEYREKVSLALDWLWRIEREYFLGHYSNARALIRAFWETNLDKYLPDIPMVDSEYRSPVEQFDAICQKLIGSSEE